jgi:TetR/AcrR family fatty acid metabolism transcriptional regulator
MAEAVKQRGNNEKRRRILDGALKAFAKKGFYNTKVAEIASEAGVADGTIYLYFKNKDDLLISLFEDRMEWVIDRLTQELEGIEGGFDKKLKAFIRLHFMLVVENRDLAEFITVELRQSAKFVKEYSNPKFGDYLKILQGLFEQAQQVGELREELDARIVSRAIFGALDEVLLQMSLSAKLEVAEIERRAAMLSQMFIHGLAPPTQ